MRRKRIWIFALVIIVVILNYGCQSAQPYAYDTSTISDISFVVIDQEENTTVVKTLDVEEIPEFLLLLSNLELHSYWNDPIECTEGNNIKITFYDGSYHLINRDSTVHYSNNKADFMFHYYEDAEFVALWDRYVDIVP
jgi:hypothetical protein